MPEPKSFIGSTDVLQLIKIHFEVQCHAHVLGGGEGLPTDHCLHKEVHQRLVLHRPLPEHEPHNKGGD